jgi:hypothetical protein
MSRVPTVGVNAHCFEGVTKAAIRISGLPMLRHTFVPHPVVDRTPEDLRAYIEGNNPISGQPVMKEIVNWLTHPFGEQELRGDSVVDRSVPRMLDPDTEENLLRLFQESHWTDFLPIVLPTPERVEAMLKGTSHAPDEIVGRMRQNAFLDSAEYTVEKVAVNAVMAGCKPEYLPVLLALASTGVSARATSITSFPMGVVINGPIRNELGMNDAIGALGPFNHANATIGRAYGLLSQNLQGGAVPGSTNLGSMGNPIQYSNMTFPEAEERSPWAPLHVRLGSQPEESTATTFGPLWNYIVSFGVRPLWRKKLVDMIRGFDPIAGAMLILDPAAARDIAEREGFPTAESLSEWLQQEVKVTAEEYWDHQSVELGGRPAARLGIEPYASLEKLPPHELVNLWSPEQINLVVTGGETNCTMSAASGTPGFGFNTGGGGKSASIDAWR